MCFELANKIIAATSGIDYLTCPAHNSKGCVNNDIKSVTFPKLLCTADLPAAAHANFWTVYRH